VRKRILIILALVLVAGLALHLHGSRGPGILESLGRRIHGH